MGDDKAKICRVAFIGAGYMASEHIKAFQGLENVDLIGIYSRTRASSERLAKEFNLQIVADSIRSLYELTNADLVVIAVPILEVRDVCLEVFGFPWATLIEKPVGYNYSEAVEILKNAGNHKTKAYVALNRRHYSGIKQARRDLSTRSGQRLIFIYDQQDRKNAELNGEPELVVQNYMYANSIHMIDLFYLFGRGSVVGVEKIIPWNPLSSNFMASKILFDSGDIGIYKAIWNGPGPWAVTVSTEGMYWEMRPVETAAFQRSGSRKLESVEIEVNDTSYKPGLRVQAIEAVNAALGRAHSLPDIEEATLSMGLVASIYGHND